MFRPVLEKALAYGDGAKGGRPPYDPVTMFKVLILAAQNTLSDARMEFLIRDRLSWLRFLGFDLGAVTPDENTIRLSREKLTRVGAIDALFTAFRPAATGSWLFADGRTDRGRHAGCSTKAKSPTTMATTPPSSPSRGLFQQPVSLTGSQTAVYGTVVCDPVRLSLRPRRNCADLMRSNEVRRSAK